MASVFSSLALRQFEHFFWGRQIDLNLVSSQKRKCNLRIINAFQRGYSEQIYTLVSGGGGGGGEVGIGATPGNSWGVLPGSPNPDPLSDQKKAIFHTRFQTWPVNAYHFQTWHRQKLCHLTQIKPLIKRFFKINFAFAYYSFFLIHLQLKGQIRSYTLVVPLKKHNPFQIQMGKLYRLPVFKPKRCKNHTLRGSIQLYGSYKGVDSSPRDWYQGVGSFRALYCARTKPFESFCVEREEKRTHSSHSGQKVKKKGLCCICMLY